jgi:tetratricopeptide (TPR) repeat protein
MKTEIENLHIKVSALMDLEEWTDCLDILNNSKDKITFDWQLYWDLGWCYYKLDKFDNSIINFKSALQFCSDKDQDKALCFGFLGISLLSVDNFNEAKDMLNQSLKIKDSNLCRTSLALCLMKLGMINEAETIHIEGLRLKPKNRERLKAYADFLSDIGKLDEAFEIYKMKK